jgi:preprotein translocase subunit SecD
MNKKCLFGVAIFLLMILLSTSCITINNPQPTTTVTTQPPNSNLQAQGGVRLVYQADLSGIAANDQTAALDSDVAVIRSRIDSLGVNNPVINELSGNRILVELPGITDVNKATQLIGQTAILEFGELVTGNTTATKWTDSLGNWNPAMGTLNGQQVELTSAYFESNTTVTTNSNGQIILVFNWNTDGSTLSGQITQRLLNKPLGIFSGDQPLKGADGHIIAPTVQAQITTSGEITGLSQTDATQLSKLLNAGRLQVPLLLIEDQAIPPPTT